jgi:hypothetical protein
MAHWHRINSSVWGLSTSADSCSQLVPAAHLLLADANP